MKPPLTRGRLILTGVILGGFVVAGVGLWLWDARNYPLPARIEKWRITATYPPTGIRHEILVRRDQLKYRREKRLWEKSLRNLDLGKMQWYYRISHPYKAGPTRGALVFRSDGKALFSPPVSPIEGMIPKLVNYTRPKYDVVRLTWKNGKLDLQMESMSRRNLNTIRLRGEFDRRPIFLWR